MSKSKHRPEDTSKPLSKKRRIQLALRQQMADRNMQFFPLPDPPQLKPLG